MMTKNVIVPGVIESLLAERGLAADAVAQELGVTEGALLGVGELRMTEVFALADTLGITPEELTKRIGGLD